MIFAFILRILEATLIWEQVCRTHAIKSFSTNLLRYFSYPEIICQSQMGNFPIPYAATTVVTNIFASIIWNWSIIFMYRWLLIFSFYLGNSWSRKNIKHILDIFSTAHIFQRVKFTTYSTSSFFNIIFIYFHAHIWNDCMTMVITKFRRKFMDCLFLSIEFLWLQFWDLLFSGFNNSINKK